MFHNELSQHVCLLMNQKLFEFSLLFFPHCNFASPDYSFYCLFFFFLLFLLNKIFLLRPGCHFIYYRERPFFCSQKKETDPCHCYVQIGIPSLMVFQWKYIFGGPDRELKTRLLWHPGSWHWILCHIQPNLVHRWLYTPVHQIPKTSKGEALLQHESVWHVSKHTLLPTRANPRF